MNIEEEIDERARKAADAITARALRESNYYKAQRLFREPGNTIYMQISGEEYVVGQDHGWHRKNPKLKMSKKDRIRARRNWNG